MTRNVKIIATVGASIFSNFQHPSISAAFKKSGKATPDVEGIIRRLYSGTETKTTSSQLGYLKETIWKSFLWYMHLEELRPKDLTWSFTDQKAINRHASAEIQSVLEMMERIAATEEVQLYLLATDTQISKMAGELVGEALKTHFQKEGRSFEVKVRMVPGLRVDDKDQFMEEGFQGLIREIEQIINESPNDANVQINITGGFKGVVPVLTVMAQLFDYPLFYMYEFSRGTKLGNVLLKIPPLPLQFDWSLIEVWQPFLTRKKISLVNSAMEKEVIEKQLIPANLFKQDNEGNFSRTTLGDLFNSYIESRTPHGRSVLGYLLEYKFYECWLDEKLTAYDLNRSVYVDGIEIDLLFTPRNQNSATTIWGEVKSYNKILAAYYKRNRKNYGFKLERILNDQISEGFLKSLGTYYLMIYYYPNQDLDNLHFNTNLRKLKETFEKKGISNFEVFLCKIDIPPYHLQNRSNPYTQSIMNKKLTLNAELFEQDQSHQFPRYLLVERYQNF